MAHTPTSPTLQSSNSNVTADATVNIPTREVPSGLESISKVTEYQLHLDEYSSLRSAIRPFPRPENVWMSRDVDYDDWKTFTGQLMPPTSTLGPDEQRDHVVKIVSEWNKNFFVPRGLKVIPRFGVHDGNDADDNNKAGSGGAKESNGPSASGFGVKLGNNYRLGLTLGPNANGYGLHWGGALLGLQNLGEDKRSRSDGK